MVLSACSSGGSNTGPDEAAPALAEIAVTPATVSLFTGVAQTFSASGTDQHGDPIAVTVTWSATGGMIDQAGDYTAGTVLGNFVVTAADGAVMGTSDVTISGSPPMADIGGPYTGVEGAPVALDGSASTDANNDIVAYDWDLDNDGAYGDATGVSPTFASASSGVFTIGLQVTDGDGASDTDSTTVTIIDIAPAVPVGLSASGDDGRVSLDWADNVEPDLAGYRVRRSTNPGGPYTDVSGLLGAGTSAYDDMAVTNGTTYFYVVTAEDGIPNVSAESAEVATTPNGTIHAYWTLDENTGTTTADTVLPDDGSGTINGAAWTTGVSGSALDFNGSSDHVVIDNTTPALNITGKAISLTAWIYPRDGGAEKGSRIMSKRTNAGGSDVYAMMTNEYRLRFRLDGLDMDSSHIIRLDAWVHVAMVYDGVDKRIYINGVLDVAAPQAKSDPIDASFRAVHLGMRESEARHFNGVLDELQIFNRALSAVEVATMYGLVVPPAPGPGLSFSDITVSGGVSDLADGGHGVMFAEVDNDSLPDLYLTNNLESNADRADQFYVNLNGVTFNEDAQARGIDDVDGGSHGAVWADLDNDGDYDLVNGSTWDNAMPYRGNPDNNNVFENDGLGFFTEVTPASISSVETETRGVVAFDMDADGDLDLFSVSGAIPPGINEAYLNDGSFAFSPHVGGVLSTAMAMQGVIDTDFDGDGDIDILAGNRSGDFAILQNDGTGIFTQILPASLGITHNAGDGISTADVDNDGDLDLLLVSDGTGNLYLRGNDGLYTHQQTFRSIEGYMGSFADLDNDGDLDLVFAGDERVFLNQGDGTFVSGPSVPVSEIADPRAIAFADIDGDGDLDFAIAARGSRNWLIRNDIDLDAGNWLRVELVSPQCQAGAFGAKVSVFLIPGDGGTFVAMREAKSNNGYLAQDDPVLHFGLGSITSVDVVVDFVDGTQVTVPGVGANGRILINECPP